jgi:uncharacterized hydrophobic protein (TIGR00271 family)
VVLETDFLGHSRVVFYVSRYDGELAFACPTLFRGLRLPPPMRLLQVVVSDERLDAVTDMLNDEGVDYVRQRTWTDGEEQWLVEFPVPTDAIGHFNTELENTGVDTETYVTITSLESAVTPGAESLQNRFADDFDPLTTPELRSKVRDMSRDTVSFLSLIFLSAVIAVAGLLGGSPEVVVGSMVIAPMVGPVLTAAVGGVLGERKMFLHSVWIQAAGLTVAIVGSVGFAFVLQAAGFYPSTLQITSLDLIAQRFAPNLITVAIGLAAGAAAAFGLMTKGPTSLIGVMIAAALIPAAATTGIATAWGDYRLAIGSLLLLLLSLALINVGASAVLGWFYRSHPGGGLSLQALRRPAVIGTVLVVVVLLAAVGVPTYQQVAFDRTVNDEVRDVLADPGYDRTEFVGVSTEYAGGPLGSPETVTVEVSRPADGHGPPGLATRLDEQITDATGQNVTVRVRVQEYQTSASGG